MYFCHSCRTFTTDDYSIKLLETLFTYGPMELTIVIRATATL